MTEIINERQFRGYPEKRAALTFLMRGDIFLIDMDGDKLYIYYPYISATFGHSIYQEYFKWTPNVWKFVESKRVESGIIVTSDGRIWEKPY